MASKLYYQCFPEVGDLVRFTDEIVKILREEGFISRFPDYDKEQLKITKVEYIPFKTSKHITFFSTSRNITDIISLEPNGTVAGPTSQRMAETIVFQGWEDVLEPRNNDGRGECFWCPRTKTNKRGGGLYDVCPKCGR
jgi:hypothetical protein